MPNHKKKKADGKLTHYTRWATWERDVLAKVVDPAGVQQLIARRRIEIDDDATEMELVRAYFHAKIAKFSTDPDKVCFFLPNPGAQVWLMEAIGEKMPINKASTKLETLGIPELSVTRKKGSGRQDRRGWRWRGTAAAKDAKTKDYPYLIALKACK